jgi:protein TonB
VPRYPCGINELLGFVDNNVVKPHLVGTKKLRVYINFIIEKDGSMTNFRILRDPDYGLGKEVLRVFNGISQKWKPGILDGKTVSTAYLCPVIINIK